MAKKQTFTLDFKPDFDFPVIAIFSSIREHKLCFQINQVLGISMVRQQDLELKLDKKGSTGQFAHFFYLSEDNEEFYLVANRGSNGQFIPEMKVANYFFVIKNRGPYTVEAEVLRLILGIRNVSSAIMLNTEEMNSTENFLLLEPVLEKPTTPHSIPPIL